MRLTHFAVLLGLVKPIITAPVQTQGEPQTVASFPNPEPCNGNCSWIHDPSVVRKDGLYYRFSTSGNIAIATSPSLQGPWEYKGSLLDHGTSIHVIDGQDIWVSFLLLSSMNKQYPVTQSVSPWGSVARGTDSNASSDPRNKRIANPDAEHKV
jgi:hypothetical protein